MAEEEGKPRVLVTGASGFIAAHVVKMLTHQGYPVRGTVRSLKNESKVQPIRDLAPEDNPLELVEANLTEETGWEEAVQGCTFVLHLASPFPFEAPKDEDEVIKPAVDGALYVLKACEKVGGVKRVVLTSSCAAINAIYNVREQPWTEEEWTDVATLRIPDDAYLKSKTLAEKAAWDFMKDLADDRKFELSVINPGYVLGPPLLPSTGASMELLRRMMNREMPFIPKIGFALCDVRDVAQAHINAMTVPEAVGQRHIIVSSSSWAKDIALILIEEFDPQGYNIPVKEIPDFFIKFGGFFNKGIKAMVPILGKVPRFDNSRMKNVLGIPGRELKNTIVDMGYKMVENGSVKKAPAYKGPKYSEAE